MTQPSFEQQGKMKSSAENPEASGAIGEVSPEQEAETRKAIAEKTQLSQSLRKAWKEKFDAFKAAKEDLAREQATMARLKIGGNLNLSEAEIAQAHRDGLEKVEAAGREASKYLEDARELEDEVEALKRGLERGVN